ncbi:MAG: PAS domain S-box protein, partial [Nitrospinae bacterium]|nr:PAS domain S-box protein [Nitrospinota bacterium]
RMTGYSFSELSGTRQHDMIHHSKSDGAPYPCEECPIYEAFRDGVERRVSNEVFWKKDGTSFSVEYVSAPIHENGKTKGAVVVFQDITDRKRAEKELNQYRNNLEVLVEKRTSDLNGANKKLMEANDLKNKFLGIASHDLRNPLYIIQSLSEALLENSQSGVLHKNHIKLLRKINSSSNHMAVLLNNLLDISKIESGKIELDKKAHDFNVILENQVELNQLIADKKGIRLIIKLGNIPLLSVDKNAMTQVIDNFISNAIKFSPPDARIDIGTDNTGNGIRFWVRDQGPGISSEDQKLLFGEFQTLSAKPTGGEKSTGLGLAIVKKIINLHGGKVGVCSEPGKGCTFYFTIPPDSKH